MVCAAAVAIGCEMPPKTPLKCLFQLFDLFVSLARELWSKIKDDVRRDFNERLKKKKQTTGTWNTGKIKLDRFLGRELCIIAWAAEQASLDECVIVAQKWLALRPEERWWLYTITNAATGHALNGKGKGWRRALRYALTENPVVGGRIDLNIVNDHSLPGLFGEPMAFYNG